MNQRSEPAALSVNNSSLSSDACYLEFFVCFNRQHYYEAHEVLERLWLPARQERNGLFLKGLIQLAGAFVHVQKHRLRPAAALFKLARTNLEQYPPTHEGLEVNGLVRLIAGWLAQVESAENPLSGATKPLLFLTFDRR